MSVDNINHREVAEPAPELKATELHECLSCSTKQNTDKLVELRCGDRYCDTCLERLFKTAMEDETMYPPYCCGRIPLKQVQQHLSKTLVRRFRAKQPELKTRQRTYCHKPACSAFIAKHSIHNDQAICQRCRAVTCNKCKSAWHFGPCVDGEDMVALMQLMQSEAWKRCPGCKRMVERNDGCNHMVCRCATEFCYGCGQLYGACACESDEEGDEEGEPYD